MPALRQGPNTESGETGLEGFREKIFLDRYARKDPERNFHPGDLVVVLTEDDPRFPRKDVGRVQRVEGDRVVVRLRTGEEVVQQRWKVDRPLETHVGQAWDRMARAAASIEKDPGRWEAEFRWLLEDFRFVPGGRIWTGLGTDQELTFYNCYVIPMAPRPGHNRLSPRELEGVLARALGRNGAASATPGQLAQRVLQQLEEERPAGNDSRQAIMDTLANMVEIMSRGGGVGINLSTLRPRYAYVAGVNGKSSGAVSWGALFSYATGLVEQGGSRRGALMLILNVWHPDVVEFITSKNTPERVRHFKETYGSRLPHANFVAHGITNANISVGVTDTFMEAVKAGSTWDLVFPDYEAARAVYDREWDGDLAAWRRKGYPVKVYATVRARDLWDLIVESAWSSAEPGVVFIERYNKMANSWYFNPVICTNPCGEQGIGAWSVCNLGHVNLSRFYDPATHDVRWEDLRRAVRGGVRFLDNVIDLTPYFFAENERVQKNERRIGLGTLGVAELLIKLRLAYGSEESLAFLDRLYRFVAVAAYQASIDLAREKGPFPACDPAKYVQSGFMQGMPEEIRRGVLEHGIRNVCLLTQAPTGTVGTMVGTSTGIEPFYSWTYYRNSRLGMREEIFERVVQEYFDEHPEVERRLDNLPPYFVSAMDLSPEGHVRVQATIQRWVDSSISKTCNVPADYTIAQTRRLYELAYDLGCKGITIYRDQSRAEQVLELKPAGPAGSPAPQGEAAGQPPRHLKKRPRRLSGATYKWHTPLGKAYITVNDDEAGNPIEVFVNIGKAGSDVAAASEALGRLTTLFLRYGELPAPRDKVALLIRHLSGIGGLSSVGFGANRVTSVPDAIAKSLVEHLGINGTRQPAVLDESTDLCPACGAATLVQEEGCFNCRSCGFSRC